MIEHTEVLGHSSFFVQRPFCTWRFVKILVESPRWSSLLMRKKSGVIFYFSQSFQTNERKNLPPKVTINLKKGSGRVLSNRTVSSRHNYLPQAATPALATLCFPNSLTWSSKPPVGLCTVLASCRLLCSFLFQNKKAKILVQWTSIRVIKYLRLFLVNMSQRKQLKS